MDNVRTGYGYGVSDYTSNGPIVSVTTNGLLQSGVPASAILYADGTETYSNGVYYYPPHLTSATNVAGYISWGFHSSLGNAYATNGSVKWTNNSNWALHPHPGVVQWLEVSKRFRRVCAMVRKHRVRERVSPRIMTKDVKGSEMTIDVFLCWWQDWAMPRKLRVEYEDAQGAGEH